jgi:hypothetical protein
MKTDEKQVGIAALYASELMLLNVPFTAEAMPFIALINEKLIRQQQLCILDKTLAFFFNRQDLEPHKQI